MHARTFIEISAKFYSEATLRCGLRRFPEHEQKWRGVVLCLLNCLFCFYYKKKIFECLFLLNRLRNYLTNNAKLYSEVALRCGLRRFRVNERKKLMWGDIRRSKKTDGDGL